MDTALKFGEYEISLQEDQADEMEFTKDLFGFGKFIVQKVGGKVHGNEDEQPVSWIERTIPGHVLLAINDKQIPSSMSHKELRALINQTKRNVTLRLRDEKIANFEKKICRNSADNIMQLRCMRKTISTSLQPIQDLIWGFQFAQAENQLRAFSNNIDPLIGISLAEVALKKVIISGDSDCIKCALKDADDAFVNSKKFLSAARSSRLHAEIVMIYRTAVAESLAILAVCQFFNQQKVAAANSLRKSFQKFVNLKSQLDGLVYEQNTYHNTYNRVLFGLGVSLVFSALVPPKLQWVLGIVGVKTDISTGLSYLKNCRSNGGIRCKWAALALCNITSAVRLGQQKRFDCSAIILEVSQSTLETLEHYKENPLFLWSAGRHYNTLSPTKGSELFQKAHSICISHNPSFPTYHLAMDIGWSYLMLRRWGDAALLFKQTMDSETAPVKKRQDASVYYAACCTRLHTSRSTEIRQHICKAIQLLETRESRDCLRNRLQVHVQRENSALGLLGFEIVYVFRQKPYLFSRPTGSHSSRSEDDLGALHDLDILGKSLALPSCLQDVVNNVLCGNALGSITVALSGEAISSQSLLLSRAAGVLAEWLVIRGIILHKLKRPHEASRLFGMVVNIATIIPSRSYTVPISFFRLAMDTYERNMGYDAEATAINLLEKADKLSGRSGGTGYDYESEYSHRIYIMLSTLRRSKKTTFPAKRQHEQLEIVASKINEINISEENNGGCKRQRTSAHVA